MSQRLTNDIREMIVVDVLIHRFRADADAFRADQAALANRVYEDIFDAKTREKMAAVPDGWLPKTTNVGVQFGGANRYEQMYFDGHISGNIRKVATKSDAPETFRLIPYNRHRVCAAVYEASHPLSIAHAKLEQRKATLDDQIETAKRSIEAALAAVTTVKRLIETWPEVAPFASKFDGEKPQLPALPTQHLNSILDLPVAEAA